MTVEVGAPQLFRRVSRMTKEQRLTVKCRLSPPISTFGTKRYNPVVLPPIYISAQCL